MSGNGQKGYKDMPYANGASAFYVYCIAETAAARTIVNGKTPPALETSSTVEVVEGDNLCAIVSRVPLAEYDELPLAQNLSDAAWLAPRAMRHEQVVEHFARTTSVVPLRFGTVYVNQEGVERMLGERRQELMIIIERLRGREEWGVNVYFDRAQLQQAITSVSPRLRELASQAEAAAPGQSYLMRKKIESLRVDEVKSEMNRLAEATEAKLSACSDDVHRLRVLKVESTEHGELKAKFAVLIKRSNFEAFHADVEHWALENKTSGMRLELSGPWPAYNFTETKSE